MLNEKKIKDAMDYFKMWVDADFGLSDDLTQYRRTAYEALRECLELRQKSENEKR